MQKKELSAALLAMFLVSMSAMAAMVRPVSPKPSAYNILYDVNKDGKVNTADVVLVVLAFNSSPGTARYEQTYNQWNPATQLYDIPAKLGPNADVNSDGLVNIVDIALVCINFAL